MDIGASAPSAQERPLSLGRGSEPRSPPAGSAPEFLKFMVEWGNAPRYMDKTRTTLYHLMKKPEGKVPAGIFHS